MFSAGMPASIARLTSKALEASMCRPSSLKIFSTVALEAAFMAYRTVMPNALGNARAAFACLSMVASS